MTSLLNNTALLKTDTSAVPTRRHVRWVTTEAGFRALAPYWDALVERSMVRTPFMTWDWVDIWWANHRQGNTLCIGVVDDPRTGVPRAIAPLMIGRPQEGKRRALRHMTFIGGLGEDASQGMDFLVPAGEENTLTPLLCGAFRRFMLKWDVIDLPTVHEESPNLPWFQATLAKFARSGERSLPQSSFLMSLPGSWDDQLALWKSKERVAYRSKWRRLMDEHEGVALEGGRDLPMAHAFDELWRLHAARFEGQHSKFLNEATHAMHRELIKRWEPRGRIMLPLLSADGKVVAARYGFAFEGKYWSYQTGFDPACAKMSVGNLSLGWAAQCAIERGLQEIDHMPGDARYKEEWSTHTRRVVHLEAFNRLSLTASVFRMLRTLSRRRNPVVPVEPCSAPCS